jgi:hypothetical protein
MVIREGIISKDSVRTSVYKKYQDSVSVNSPTSNDRPINFKM